MPLPQKFGNISYYNLPLRHSQVMLKVLKSPAAKSNNDI